MIPELAAGKQRKYLGPIMLTEVSIAVLDRGFCDIQATDSLPDMFGDLITHGRDLRTVEQRPPSVWICTDHPVTLFQNPKLAFVGPTTISHDLLHQTFD
jgi:hypothetical protein